MLSVLVTRNMLKARHHRHTRCFVQMGDNTKVRAKVSTEAIEAKLRELVKLAKKQGA